ncbi:MAG: hypothetical protein GC185_02920 [Alphaproteobacteria bacterium]|nr:hypothetical protein [Alphaproteobacteria bacterium]
MALTFRDIKRAIIASLSPELLEKKYRELLSSDDPPETGHCAVASEAFYHIAGGKQAGFMPVVCGYAANDAGEMVFKGEVAPALQKGWRKETHWWIKGPKDGKRGAGAIFDVTAGQYPEAYPYEKGHNTGFMQPQQKPSKRAQIIIDRVTEKLGAQNLAAYRRANIAAFAAAQRGQKRQKAPSRHA